MTIRNTSEPGTESGTAGFINVPRLLLHGLRTPLGQILGYCELLMEQALEEGRGDVADDLSAIREASFQLLSLIEGNFICDPVAAPDKNTSPT